MIELGSYVQVNLSNGDYYRVIPEDEPRIDSQVESYLTSGKTKDSIIEITCKDGSMIKVLASEISDWYFSTLSTRKINLELQKLHEDEERMTKQALGMWEE